MFVTDILSPSTIKISMDAKDKQSAMLELAHLIVPDAHMSADELTRLLMERDAIRTTGYGKGVALPRTIHAKGHAMALGRCAPMDWNAVDNKPVTLIFIFVSPARHCSDHIHLLSNVARVLTNDVARDAIMSAKTAEEIWNVFSDLQPRKLKQLND